jgi:DNA invertase Pin-like site-specific DNA recombinase
MTSHSKWYALRERQKQERIEQVRELAQSRITQTQAARELGVSLQTLNRFIQLNDIFWPVVKQGVRSNG